MIKILNSTPNSNFSKVIPQNTKLTRINSILNAITKLFKY